MPRGHYERKPHGFGPGPELSPEVKAELAKPVAPAFDQPEVCEVIVRLQSGSFECRISCPLDASEDAKREFVDSWMSLMVAGLRLRTGKELP